MRVFFGNKKTKASPGNNAGRNAGNVVDIEPVLSRKEAEAKPALGDLSPMSSVARAEFDMRETLLGVNRRLQRAVILSCGAALTASAALMLAMPLKKVVPYVVNVNTTTGEVTAPRQQMSEHFEPAWANESFFVRRWIEDMLTISQHTTVNINAPRAQEFLRGSTAIAEYQNFRASDHTFERMAADTNMVRTIKIENFTPIAGTKNGAVANVTLTTIAGGMTKSSNILLTVYWVILPPQGPEDIDRNPIGLYITDFKVSGNTSGG